MLAARGLDHFVQCGGLGPILLGIAVLVALRLLGGTPEMSQPNIVQLLLRSCAWTLIWVGGGALVAMVVFLVIGQSILAAMFFLAITAIVAGRVARGLRIARQRALLKMLAVACEHHVALVPVVEAFAAEHWGPAARRARRLAWLLRSGTALPDALDRCRGLVPPDVLVSIRVGYRSGRLAPTLREAAASQLNFEPIWQAVLSKLFYCGFVGCAGLFIMTFVMLKVVPQFQKIFEDFDADLPDMTQALISTCRVVGDYSLPFVVLLFFVVLPVLFFHTLLHDTGVIQFRLPGVSRFVRRFDAAAIMETLALATEQKQPLDQAVATLGQYYPVHSVRARLRKMHARMEAGVGWCDAMLGCGLIGRADHGLLLAAERVGNLPWALREMADSNRRRLARRIHIQVQALYVPILLGMSVLALFVVVGLFMPLISLVQKLT